MSLDPTALGIPADADIWRSSGDIHEGWRVTEIGVRLRNPPPRPWPWPYGILRSGSGHAIAIQIWCRTFAKPGFEYSVTWHPELGRRYHVGEALGCHGVSVGNGCRSGWCPCAPHAMPSD